MIDTTFTLDSLSRPETALSYNVDRALAQAFPQQYCLSTNRGIFNVEEFAADGHCRIRVQQSPHPQIFTEWRAKDYPFDLSLSNVWLDVEWEDERFTIVIMHWP